MLRVYVAGPYRNQRGTWFVRENIRAAELVGAEVAKMGAIPIVPHLMWAGWDGLVPDETFLAWGLSVLDMCDVLVVLPNSDKSAGTFGEYKRARDAGKVILYWPECAGELRRMVENAKTPAA